MPGSSSSREGRSLAADLYAPSVFEVSSGWLHGFISGAVVSESSEEGAAEALRNVLRDPLLGGPCVVPFSGGRDSSLLLAVACSVAREAGVGLPTAVTFRYPGQSEADENDWQEMVMNHLAGLGFRPAWRIREISDELDVVGPTMAPLLEEVGHPLWPPGVAGTVAMAREAAGATVLSGEHGDSVLGMRRATVLSSALRRRGRGLSIAHWRMVAAAATPRPVAAVGVRLKGWYPPWLAAAGRHRWRRLAAADTRQEKLRWDESIRRTVAGRGAAIGSRTLEQLAHRVGSRLLMPLADTRVIAALAYEGGSRGLGSRRSLMGVLGRELLPESLYARETKASFNASRLNGSTRMTVAGWRGEGVDPQWVNVSTLQAIWSAGPIPPLTAGLIQAAWLARHGIGEW